jgi:hypothetical protein
MSDRTQWLKNLGRDGNVTPVEGLVGVAGYSKEGRPPEEVAIMEKAAYYGAQAVFFEASRNGSKNVAQAFVYVAEDQPANSPDFAELHQRLWSWGGVPLVYRKTAGVIQLFRCGHKPDFADKKSEVPVCKPFSTLKLAADIYEDPWWDAGQLLNGTLWDKPEVCKQLLSSQNSAQKSLIRAVKKLNKDLSNKSVLPKHIRRRLLILSLLIAYLEERKVLLPEEFSVIQEGAKTFADILPNGPALVQLLEVLEERFNGHVFSLPEADREILRNSNRLDLFAGLLHANQEANGQLTLWQLYSFRDLPVELISEVYQLFVKDADSSVYTPPFLVRFMLDEVLTSDRLDRLEANHEVILDPSCGSGVFLVEAYKKIILHWRSRNHWKKPTVAILKKLIQRVHGIDLEEGAVELASFSLCLAFCDALKSEEIRATIKPFPALVGKTLHSLCYFKALEQKTVTAKIGVIIGNPPFASTLSTPDAVAAYKRYGAEHETLPDKQLAYLFLHESMKMLEAGGLCCLLQQYNLIYNQQSASFRKTFFQTWDVREILDFISVRGLFQKGGGDTKVLVVVAEASAPVPDRQIHHATFRRTGRTEAEQGFDLDCYDMHWLTRDLILANDGVWRSNLLGGGRVLDFVNRMKQYRTLGQYAESQGWDYGEGFIEGAKGVTRDAEHIIGKEVLPSEALTASGIDETAIEIMPDKPIEGPRTIKRFTPPMLLIREQMDLPHAVWDMRYLTYKDQIVGFTAPPTDISKLECIYEWLQQSKTDIRAYVAASSTKLFSKKATALSGIDILALPYPEDLNLNISPNETIIAEDIVDHYRDLIRLGEDSAAMQETGHQALPAFTETFCAQINGLYNNLTPLPSQSWPGIICQPFVFGSGEVDWTDADGLRNRLNRLLHEQKSPSLNITRMARIYDDRFIFLLKPDRLRYWLRSIALRDADETLADLRDQGF